MLEESDTDFAEAIQASLELRVETFQEMLMGKMNPLDRRFQIVSRRPSLVFGGESNPPASSSLEPQPDDDSSSEEDSEQERSGFDTADSVELEIESPSEDEIRVANFLAEKHSDAETIALSSEDTIEVREASGGAFLVDVTDVLEREFGEVEDVGTVESATPSMSSAVAEKHNS